MDMTKKDYIEKILWSIALPGFGQLLNGKLFKGLILIILEFLINTKANLNEIIILSFYGNTIEAVKQTDYHWLMFYPCVYMFAIWDAFRDSGGHRIPYAFIPFVISAYLGTIGVIYSSTFTLGNILLGPIWLSIGSLILGILIGLVVRYISVKSTDKNKQCIE